LNKVDKQIIDRMSSEDRYTMFCRSLMDEMKRLEGILNTSTDDQKRESARTQLMILRNWAYDEKNQIYPPHIIKKDGIIQIMED